MVAQGVSCHLGADAWTYCADVLWRGSKGVHHPLAESAFALAVAVPYPQAYGKRVCPTTRTHDGAVGRIGKCAGHFGTCRAVCLVVNDFLTVQAVLLFLCEFPLLQFLHYGGIATKHVLHGGIGICHGGYHSCGVLALLAFLPPAVSIGKVLDAGIEVFILWDVLGLVTSRQHRHQEQEERQPVYLIIYIIICGHVVALHYFLVPVITFPFSVLRFAFFFVSRKMNSSPRFSVFRRSTRLAPISITSESRMDSVSLL